MRMVFVAVIIVVGGLLAYVRFAPVDVARWHQPITAQGDKDFAGGAIRVIPAGPDGLMRIDTAMRALPRTSVLAGSVEEGRVTYVTRSKVIGFPDYTTVQQDGDTIRMFARLRFGQSDLGVNSARLRQLMQGLN